MKFASIREMSRLKKKLLIYFLLISIVSISVSAEVILEVSSRKFMDDISGNFYKEIKGRVSEAQLKDIIKNSDYDRIYEPIYKFRNRMILFLMVVTVSIISAFYLFAKDIVSPMDSLVEATKKIARGDLTVTVPVMSQDEIGQLGGLINDMNVNLQDLIFQVKQEVNRYREKIIMAQNRLLGLMESYAGKDILTRKRMKVSDFKEILSVSNELVGFLDIMSNDLTSLEAYINAYKVYSIHSEISQNEIEEALKDFTSNSIKQ